MSVTDPVDCWFLPAEMEGNRGGEEVTRSKPRMGNFCSSELGLWSPPLQGMVSDVPSSYSRTQNPAGNKTP